MYDLSEIQLNFESIFIPGKYKLKVLSLSIEGKKLCCPMKYVLCKEKIQQQMRDTCLPVCHPAIYSYTRSCLPLLYLRFLLIVY